MTLDLSLAQSNLTSVVALCFLLGFIAARLKSDIRIPEPVYQFISVYLLLGIGLKGGHALKGVTFNDFWPAALATLFLGATIPLAAFYCLKWVKKLSIDDRGAFAAHYGSTSLVTFTAALLYIENSGMKVEGFATALLTLLEIPGLVVGVFLASRTAHEHINWGKTALEVLFGKTVLLLTGGLALGFITSESGFQKVVPFFVDTQSGLLALFLLNLGYIAGTNWPEIKHVGLPIAVFAIIFPLLAGTLGALVGTAVGLSVGGAAILAVLSASASYIAAPAVVSVALPKAKGSLAMTASIGVTFPFNLLLGIPSYLLFASI
ncbi:MAG: sodium-dependent bicarbonate transport family permease [Micrococcales bacterium]|nr:sodium-dependent bicarbonate transport family permease [Micrococcales bacterium]